MINNEQFGNRIKKIMEHHDFSASLFADKIGVQRSSISHILSGRNKPSLDFVIKVTDAIPDVDIEWLMKGKGQYPNSVSHAMNKTTSPTTSLFDSNQSNAAKRIQRIVVFFDDGTFDEYHK